MSGVISDLTECNFNESRANLRPLLFALEEEASSRWHGCNLGNRASAGQRLKDGVLDRQLKQEKKHGEDTDVTTFST